MATVYWYSTASLERSREAQPYTEPGFSKQANTKLLHLRRTAEIGHHIFVRLRGQRGIAVWTASRKVR